MSKTYPTDTRDQPMTDSKLRQETAMRVFADDMRSGAANEQVIREKAEQAWAAASIFVDVGKVN